MSQTSDSQHPSLQTTSIRVCRQAASESAKNQHPSLQTASIRVCRQPASESADNQHPSLQTDSPGPTHIYTYWLSRSTGPALGYFRLSRAVASPPCLPHSQAALGRHAWAGVSSRRPCVLPPRRPAPSNAPRRRSLPHRRGLTPGSWPTYLGRSAASAASPPRRVLSAASAPCPGPLPATSPGLVLACGHARPYVVT